MKWIGFRVPLPIVNRAHQTNQLYPFAISLIESVRTYEMTCNKIEENQRQNIGLLCAGLRRDAQLLITEGTSVIWESYRLAMFVQRFAENVLQFQEKVDDLLHKTREIDHEVKSLETCVYSKAVFEGIIGERFSVFIFFRAPPPRPLIKWFAFYAAVTNDIFRTRDTVLS